MISWSTNKQMQSNSWYSGQHYQIFEDKQQDTELRQACYNLLFTIVIHKLKLISLEQSQDFLIIFRFTAYNQMKQEYYFRVLFNNITLENDLQPALEAQTLFHIEIYKNKKLIGQTSDKSFQLGQNKRIPLQNELFNFTISSQQTEKKPDICEIRLVQVYTGGKRIMGRYRFTPYNYIKANKKLNRSCVQMLVQIAQNFKIDYVVYFNATLQALTKIMQQHQAAKKQQMLQWNQGQHSFFPEEIGHLPLQDSFSKIGNDLQSPLIIHQRYWSPNRGKRLPQNSSYFKQQSQLQTNQEKTSSPVSKIKHLKKTFSTLSDNSNNLMMKRRFSEKQKRISVLMQQQVDCLRQVQDPEKQIKQLYQVLKSGPKLTYSSLLSSQLENHQNPQKQVINVSADLTGTQDSSRLLSFKDKIKFKIIGLLIVLFVFLAFSAYDLSDKTCDKNKGKKKQKSSKTKSKM